MQQRQHGSLLEFLGIEGDECRQPVNADTSTPMRHVPDFLLVTNQSLSVCSKEQLCQCSTQPAKIALTDELLCDLEFNAGQARMLVMPQQPSHLRPMSWVRRGTDTLALRVDNTISPKKLQHCLPSLSANDTWRLSGIHGHTSVRDEPPEGKRGPWQPRP